MTHTADINLIKRRLATRLIAATGASLLMGAGLSALAQTDGLAKFVVPFPAGGAADTMGRILVERLKEELKQNIVVENRAGASTRVAAEHLKNAPPDGNTVLMTLLDTTVIAPLA